MDRVKGFDVARALAILGMILVNTRGKLDAYASDFEWLVWASNRIEGKSAALFVVLAGIGVSLRTRRARAQPHRLLRGEQVALAQRAAILFGLGILMLPVWSWDILHFYGVYLALAAVWLGVRDRTLLLLALAFVLGEVALFTAFDWWADRKVFTPRGVVRDIFFNGLHPLFPWMAFLLVGMWLGRRDLADRRFRRRLLVVASVVFIAVELLDAAARPGDDGRLIAWEHVEWLRTWPRPARPMFVLCGLAFAIATVCACLELAERFEHRRPILVLVATGQLAFTIYVLHVAAAVIPVRLGLFPGAALEHAMLYGLVFFVLAAAGSVAWRRRFTYGPLEGLLRRLTAHHVASRNPS